jgi:hypothetical protein
MNPTNILGMPIGNLKAYNQYSEQSILESMNAKYLDEETGQEVSMLNDMSEESAMALMELLTAFVKPYAVQEYNRQN